MCGPCAALGTIVPKRASLRCMRSATALGVALPAVLALLPVLCLAVAMAVAVAVLRRRGGGEGDRRANAQRDEWPVDSDLHLASFGNRAASSEAPCCAPPPRDGFAISRSEVLRFFNARDGPGFQRWVRMWTIVG